METQQRADLRDYLAAERTLLAWIRTGLALMGFGFVVARFGLFLQQLLIAQHASAVQPSGLSLWFGTALIGAGVLVNLLSGWHHIQLIRAITPVQGGPLHSTTLAVSTAIFLALVGVAMATYLLSLRGSTDLQSTVASLSGERGNNEERPVTPGAHKGIIDKPSNHPVDQIVETLKTTLQSKGVTLFAVVDHSGEAAKVGMNMRPTKLLIFGSPKAGTPLMLAAPSTAIDLPLKILVWEDAGGKAWISYNSPQYLQERHGFPLELLANVAVIESLAAAAAK
jgi:uncharacterized protein (DUF302 family)/uncharacterized membrane protein YidH (DUF202 family)